MQTAMPRGRVTSRELVRAVSRAHRDLRGPAERGHHREPRGARRGGRARSRARGGQGARAAARHPVALKDNIHTTDMPTTGGALAFEGFVPPYEATLTKNLRDAGAIIIAKTQLTELANWVAGAPTPMPTNYNALAGYGLQSVRSAARSARRHLRRTARAAHRRIELGHRHGGELLGGQRRHRDLRLDPEPGEPEHARRRSSPRSDASAATASSRSPPIRTRRARWRARSPMPRSCSACWKVRARIRTIRRRRSARRRATATTRRSSSGRRSRARASASRARSTTTRSRRPAATEPRGGLNDAQAQAMDDAIAILKRAGRDHRRSGGHPERGRPDAAKQLSCVWTLRGRRRRKGKDDECSIVFKYGMKRDFNTWLAHARRRSAGEDPDRAARVEPSRTRSGGAIKYGQSLLDISDEMDLEADRRALRGRPREGRRARRDATGSTRCMKDHRLDALLFPGGAGADDRRATGLSDGDGALRAVAERADAAVPGRLRGEADAVRCELHRDGVQRAAAAGAGVRFEQATRRRVPPPATP